MLVTVVYPRVAPQGIAGGWSAPELTGAAAPCVGRRASLVSWSKAPAGPAGTTGLLLSAVAELLQYRVHLALCRALGKYRCVTQDAIV